VGTVYGVGHAAQSGYQGKACFGKTERAARKKITRPLRQRGGHSSRCGAHRERPRPEWIEIAVPALVSDATFALAQEQLENNKRHSPRRTVAPSLLQGMLVCQQCGYALYRSSAQTSKQKLYYYRCIGSDGYRHLRGPVCTNRPIRQDYLDQFVWQEIIRVLEEPELIQAEIQRRLEAARKSDPVRKREQSLRRELTRIEASTERLLTAYQENLLTLAELRRRMPELRKQQQAIQSELTSMELAASDQSRYLRLTHRLTEFRERLHAKSETMEVPERQKILRLLVKEILVGSDTITVRHSLPIAGSEPPSGDPVDVPKSPKAPSGTPSGASYLLRSGSGHRPLGCPCLRLRPILVLDHSRLQPFLDQPEHSWIRYSVLDELHHPFVFYVVEKSPHVAVQHPVDSPPPKSDVPRVQRLMLVAPWPEPIGESLEVLLINQVEDGDHRLLNDFVFQCRDAQWPLPAILLPDIHSP
jgi:site-specific DNA recombinase